MKENKSLSHSAYGGVNGKDYVPFISANGAIPELTVMSIVIGCVFAMIFASANTYLALKVGMTIAAGIPAAILGTATLKFIFKKNNILEANMISGIAAMGESLAGGIVFTLPAIIIWGMDLRLTTIVLITCLGGLLGILFVVPFRKFLIVEEHGSLTFPESMATAEVLVTANEGGDGFKTVLTGLAVGSVYKLLSGGFLLWSEEAEWNIKLNQNGKPIYETLLGIDPIASLAGVGFIVGIKAALYMFAGSVLAWLGLIPLIKYIGAGLTTPIFPATDLIANMSPGAIREDYIQYIGAGAVAAGGFIALTKSLPTMLKSFRAAMSGLSVTTGMNRMEKDVPMTWVIGAAALVFFLSWLLPGLNLGLVGALLAVLFSFLFAVVSARISGIIGATYNPISGMTIATLLFSTAVLKSLGIVGNKGMVVAILVGGMVCVAIAVAGSAGQVLKTTFILGGTPRYLQLGMYAGVVLSSVATGAAMILLIHTYGIGGERGLAAPQATLMSMVVKGVMTAQLPWSFVIIGAMIGVMCELMGLPVLAVALGIYLPIHLSTGILVGGIIRILVNYKYRKNDKQQKTQTEKGILLASGLVAGDAMMGIVVAVIAALNLSDKIGIGANDVIARITKDHWTALGVYLILAYWIYRHSCKVDKKAEI